MALTLADVTRVVGGMLTPLDAEGVVVTGVCSDSRDAAGGSLFVALVGERVDGHEFVAAAATAGAVAVLGTRPTELPTVVVPDVLVALGLLARHHLEHLDQTTVVAITGSVGKTTAKDLTAAVLSAGGPTVAPPGSFNNELGLPLTVLSADLATRFLVLEMGARGLGHVAYLCEVAPPDVGVELNVGSAHVGEFGDQATIAEAKAELVAALPRSGVAVLNADDPLVRPMARRTAASVTWFGANPDAHVRAVGVELDRQGRAAFDLVTPEGTARARLRHVGEHAVPNALAAAAVGRSVGLPVSAVAEALSEATPRSRWRMEVVERPDGLVVINDAYNASPESMRAALKSLKQIAAGRRCWAVLGEMRELGDRSAAEHDAVGRLAVRLDVQRLVVVGEGARPMHLAAGLEGSWDQESIFVPDAQSAVDLLVGQVTPEDVVLVKASRAAGLEQVAAALLEEADS